MVINFIRHSYTKGNLRHAYIGSTDEPLCEEGRKLLEKISYPACNFLFASPMKRCMETAALIYKGMDIIRADGLRECDFGHFEGKNHIEMENDAEYKSWIKGGGTGRFPGGEDPEAFRKRCACAFISAISDFRDDDTVSFVVHGGTIMSVMENYAVPARSFYEWHVKNACGYICEFKDGKLRVTGLIG